MHWLSWAEIVRFLTTWQGLVAAGLAALAAIYYGPRKMLETWDWYWDRFRDSAVLFIIERRRIVELPDPYRYIRMGAGLMPQEVRTMEVSYTAQELADSLKRPLSSINGSLKRLSRKGTIEPYHNGWRLRVKG